MDDGLAALNALLPDVRLSRPQELGGNERTAVRRVAAEYPDGTKTSLITKQYRSSGEGWVRESAALSVLPASVLVPRIVAEQQAPPVLIVSDLGGGPSVADALLGDDPAAAEHAVCAWAAAMARLHCATFEMRDAFREALDVRAGELPVRDAQLGNDIEHAARVLDRACVTLEVRMPDHALDELRGLTKRLGSSGIAALTPADACPDNNVLTDRGLALLDFEGAQWRHVAWDVAYLVVPWPTCWCSWRLPEQVRTHALQTYRDTAAAALPAVSESTFAQDVSAAAVGWAMLTCALFLDNALGSDPALNPDKPTPTRRAMIAHRLGAASRNTELSALAELAGVLAAALHRRWGDVPLDFAPAFRSAQ